MEIEDAVALVTGANRGLGKAYVEALLGRGAARIYAGARDPSTLAPVVALDPRRIVPVVLDVTREGDAARAAVSSSDVTLLINNAGVFANFGGFVMRPDNAAIRHEMEVNYFGVLALCQAFAPVLAHNGGGAIVNVLSILATIATPVTGSYCASKFAALAMTRCLRAELALQRTLVVAAMPGTIDTDMAKDYAGPKVSPGEAAAATLDAVVAGDEEIYIGDQARGLAARHRADPEAVAREHARFLPMA